MPDFAPLSIAKRLVSGAVDKPPSVLGRFELLRVLGRGAQTTVWLAFDPRLQRQVAIKLMRPVQDQDASALDHWLREARHGGALAHPFIVPVFEADVQGRQPYVVFEYVPGRTLAEHLAQQGRCAPHDAVALVVDLLDGLQAAHAAGMVHGDLKPSNVMVDNQRHARLMDFGMAAPLQAEPGVQGDSGTPVYLAPEAAGGAAPSPASDLYAAAVVLVELLTGRPLMHLPDGWHALYRSAGEVPTLPEDLGQGVDHTLRAILQRALARSPAARYATAGEFGDALRAWAAPVSAPTAASNATLDFLLRRMRHKSDFPALSDSVARIQRVANSEDDSISDLTHEILKDVALTNKLLRLVNSVHYAHASRGTVSTVSRAVSLVGFNAVRNIALSLVLLDHMEDKAHASQMREEFLRAMMAGSVAAELCSPGQLAEEAFIGAMFQNLGRMLCEFYFPEEAQQVRSLVAAGRLEGGEESAAVQVLGLGFEDLGAGVARVWGLPESLQRCMRKPMGTPPMRPPEQGVERLRWVAMAANEVASTLLHSGDAHTEHRLQQTAARYARTLALTHTAITEATLRARHKLVALAQALDLKVEPGSAAARLLTVPAPLGDAVAPPDALALLELRAAETPPLPAVLESQATGTVSAAQVNEVLAAGIQDITNAMVENFQLNDVLRMILETMFRALGFRRMVFCLREARTDQLTGRFGLGEDSESAVRALRVPLKTPGDLFAAVCVRGADTLINDATQSRMQARLPQWYVQGINAPAFLLLPLQIKGQPFALIYADQSSPGGIAVDDKVLGLLRTLRNQAVMAFRQAS
ncbi:serine/threonine protein kinase [Acidovorax carolinensis]|uniref:Serine/threonine protein kinase n=1 Tax=Acidovorax carolinensis TaxID=553814 RepID=A0A240U7U1_9BURK|nr:serine/threonine protein kinase [Acidovorax carolinensis]ART53467.1 serine/threonine protein kinase [Acidovorax carolinensis]